MENNIVRKIQTFDATEKAIGRLATEIATVLRGKHKASYQPHIDAGDIVEVKNITLAIFGSAKKQEQKKYFRHSQHPGGLKTTLLKELVVKNPSEVLRKAVREMLPATRLRPGMLKRLIIR